MSADQARELFSLASDVLLDDEQQREFDAALDADPALAQEYAAFCATLDAVSSAVDVSTPSPDLLRGVQSKLRNASGGRYYGDRFSERSGVGGLSPWLLLGLCAALLVLAFAAVELLDTFAISFGP